MRASLDAKAFVQALERVSSMIRKSVIPVLNAVLVRFKDNRCTLTSTNIEAYLSASVPAGGDEFSFLLDRPRETARAFRQFDGELTLEQTEAGEGERRRIKLVLSCGPRSAELHPFLPEDFPRHPAWEPKHSFTTNASRLSARIERVKYAVGVPCKEEARACIVSVQLSGNRVYAVDGYRMAWDTDPELDVPVPFMAAPAALEQSSRTTIAAGQEQRAQLNELNGNDAKAKAVFEQFQADDVAGLEQQLAVLKVKRSEDSPADGLRAQIQQLTADLEYGNLSEPEYAQLKECREELRECAAGLKAAQAAASRTPEDFDGKIKAAQDQITTLKSLMTSVAVYISERAKLTFSALKMNRVEISLYDIVKTTGERKDVFKFSYGGRRYDRLSLSEKIRAGMEVSELMKRLTGRNYPVFVDNMESVDDLNNVRPTGQVIMAKCVSGAPLAVRPVRPISLAQRQAA